MNKVSNQLYNSMNKTRLIFSIIIISLIFSHCEKQKDEISKSNLDVIYVDDIQPGQIEKIDDYQLYYMRFNENYGFDNYLNKGIASVSTNSDIDSQKQHQWACTCFAAFGNKDSSFFGRNFDFYHGACMLLHTEPSNAFSSYSMVDLYYCGFSANVSYQELLDNPDKLKKAPYLPFDGVNEKGVAIGLMAVPDAEPPYDENKVTLYDLALIRLVLDYAEDTEHAINLLRNFNYRPSSETPVHFLIADKLGNAAIIEYVENDIKITRNSKPYIVSTNFIVYNYENPKDAGCTRFNFVNSALMKCDGCVSRIESMNILENVSQDITMWSLVYDMNSFNNIDISIDRKYNKTYRFTKY